MPNSKRQIYTPTQEHGSEKVWIPYQVQNDGCGVEIYKVSSFLRRQESSHNERSVTIHIDSHATSWLRMTCFVQKMYAFCHLEKSLDFVKISFFRFSRPCDGLYATSSSVSNLPSQSSLTLFDDSHGSE